MKSILLVEDNFDERMLVKRLLKKLDLDVALLMAEDGQVAVDMLEEFSVKDLPKLILLDLKMPRMNGHQVLEWIRGHEKTKHIPVIVFSSSDDQHDIKFSYQLGANSYVQKKVKCNDDLELLSNYWIDINKLPH